LDIARETIDGTNRSGQPSRGWVTISPYVLPREDEFSSSERWKEAAGPKNWNPQQGFYFYRNDRLLQAGGWSHIRSVDEHLKLLRIAVDFNGALDQSFSLNVTKMRAKIPAEIRESVSSAVSKWAKVARERYDHRSSQHSSSLSAPEPSADRPPRRNAPPPRITVGRLSLALSNVPTPYLSVSPGSQAGTVSIVVPQGHELAQMFSSRGSLEEGRDPKRLCAVALAVLEAVFEGRMRPEDIPLSSLRRAFNRVR
jgi:hypothetical protein